MKSIARNIFKIIMFMGFIILFLNLFYFFAFKDNILNKNSTSEILTIIFSLYLMKKFKTNSIKWVNLYFSTLEDRYPNSYAMVESLMGHGDKQLIGKMKNRTFKVEEVFFIGLKSLHVY